MSHFADDSMTPKVSPGSNAGEGMGGNHYDDSAACGVEISPPGVVRNEIGVNVGRADRGKEQ